MNEVKITALKPDEKLLINLPEFTTRELVEWAANEIGNAMKDPNKKVIITAGCEIFIVKPDTKIAVDKNKFTELMGKL